MYVYMYVSPKAHTLGTHPRAAARKYQESCLMREKRQTCIVLELTLCSCALFVAPRPTAMWLNLPANDASCSCALLIGF